MNRRQLAFAWIMALGFFTATCLCTPGRAQTQTVLHNFGGPIARAGAIDGANPHAGLVFDSQGNLYGTTTKGGVLSCPPYSGCGTVFELIPHSGGAWSEKILSLYAGTPIAPVVLDRNGDVYGTYSCEIDCFNNYGGVFELIPHADGTWTGLGLTDDEFQGCPNPNCGVDFDKVGHLYGTTHESGSGSGEVFSLRHVSFSKWNTRVLYTFTGGDDGGGPSIGLTFDSGGNMYGTTSSGGAFGNGTVFKLAQNAMGLGWTESVIYSFYGGSDGLYPNGGMVFDLAGNLYGTTNQGGMSGAGTVFQLTLQSNGSWSESVLYSFQGGSDASRPVGPVIFDGAGDLYGVAGGGSHGHGAVFKLTPLSGGRWTESVVHSFTGGLDGDSPSGSVILDNAGNLYGTTIYGGVYSTCSDEPYCGGVAYEITP
jgi:uncharacterized repeat protein (TIGR03803 family)